MFQAIVLVCGMLNSQPYCTEFAANEMQKTKPACEEHMAASLPSLIEELAAQGFVVVQHEGVCINKANPT